MTSKHFEYVRYMCFCCLKDKCKGCFFKDTRSCALAILKPIVYDFPIRKFEYLSPIEKEKIHNKRFNFYV